MSQLFSAPFVTVLDENGNPISGARAYFYETGTTTPQSVYTSSGLGTPHANPVIADSAGRLPAIFLDPALIYRCDIKTAGDVLIKSVDPINYDLARELAESGGAALIGFIQAGTGTEASTLQAKARERLSINDFAGADPTGATDSAAAINAAIVVAQSTGLPIHVDGVYLHNSQIVVPAYVRFVGCGHLVSDKSQRSKSCFVKNFNGVGFLFSGDESGTDGVQYDSAAAKTGDNVQVTGTRWNAPSICVTNSGNDNLRIGKTETGASTLNTNAWFIGRLHSYGATRDGIRIDHTNTTGSSTFPLGAPDCGGGTLVSFDIRDNGGSGIVLGNTIDNRLVYGLSQQNGEYGVRFTAGAFNNQVDAYSEDNTLGDVLLDAPVTNGSGTAQVKQNIGLISRAASLQTAITDNSTNNSNRIDCHSANVGGTTFDLAPIAWNGDFYQGSMLATPRDTLEHKIYVSVNYVGAGWKVTTDGASGTKIIWVTRTSGVGETDKLELSNDGWLDIKTAAKGLKVNGTQVVTTRQAAVTAPTGGATVDSQARTAINDLIARLQAHGLIS